MNHSASEPNHTFPNLLVGIDVLIEFACLAMVFSCRWTTALEQLLSPRRVDKIKQGKNSNGFDKVIPVGGNTVQSLENKITSGKLAVKLSLIADEKNALRDG